MKNNVKGIEEKVSLLVKLSSNKKKAGSLQTEILNLMHATSERALTQKEVLNELDQECELLLLCQSIEKAKFMLSGLVEDYFCEYNIENEDDRKLWIPHYFSRSKTAAEISLDYLDDGLKKLDEWKQIAEIN
jgi:hypothetical protein